MDRFQKSLIIIIFFLSFCLIVTPSSGVILLNKPSLMNSDGIILYVGGIGPGNYTGIQDAIDNASNGDTIFVYNESSPYYENIIIDKSIRLIGENRNNTIIDGSKKKIAINVIADYVNISGFTIQYGDLFGIKINSMYNTIINNIITEQGHGIQIHKSSYNSIISNIFSNNGDGIEIYQSNINILRDNDISKNGWGVFLWDGQNNDISGNNISDNGNGISLVESSNYNIIKNNNICSNREEGIWVDESNSNNISCNNISKNKYGIHISQCNNNTISKNNIKNNEDSGIIGFAFYNNIIFLNNFINNVKNTKIYPCDNIWDDGEYGNYWSDYRDKYPFARKIWEKGIWDTPYEIYFGDNKDNCPLIKQWPNVKARDITRNTASYSNYFFWILGQFPLLKQLFSIYFT